MITNIRNMMMKLIVVVVLLQIVFVSVSGSNLRDRYKAQGKSRKWIHESKRGRHTSHILTLERGKKPLMDRRSEFEPSRNQPDLLRSYVDLKLRGREGEGDFHQRKPKMDPMDSYLQLQPPAFDGILQNVTCDICKVFVWQLRYLANDSTHYNRMVDEAIFLCIYFKISDDRLCRMMINEYKDIVKYVLIHLVLSPSEACGLLLGKKCCCSPFVPGGIWNVTLPDTPKPPPQPPTPPKPGSPTLRFVYVTDIHMDFQYAVGSPWQCSEPVCCRDNVNGTGQAGEFGSYEKCDIPRNLAVTLFENLASRQDEFDYVIFGGDIPAHDLWNQTQEDQLTHLHVLEQLFETYLPFKPVYYVMGNHDSAPCDSFIPPSLNAHGMDWLYNEVADVWGRWLPPESVTMVRRCGTYSVSPIPGFRIISLNNVYGSRLNLWLLVDDVDPCGVLKFFVEELQKAEDAGEKVHVLTHIPPGVNYMRKAWSYNYYKIVNRYENTIVNQFVGHSHNDFYEMFYDDVTFKRPVGVVMAAPSVTTYINLNPSYRIYTVDGNYKGSSWAVLDYENYYVDLSSANQHHKATWEVAYSPKSFFNMTSLYPADWDALLDRLEQNDDLLQDFYRIFNNMHPQGRCIGECRKRLLCLLIEGRSYDPNLCKNIRDRP